MLFTASINAIIQTIGEPRSVLVSTTIPSFQAVTNPAIVANIAVAQAPSQSQHATSPSVFIDLTRAELYNIIEVNTGTGSASSNANDGDGDDDGSADDSGADTVEFNYENLIRLEGLERPQSPQPSTSGLQPQLSTPGHHQQPEHQHDQLQNSLGRALHQQWIRRETENRLLMRERQRMVQERYEHQMREQAKAWERLREERNFAIWTTSTRASRTA